MFVYVGTNTGPGKAEGIGVFRLDEESGALEEVQTLGDRNNPTFVALHPQRPYLYAVERSLGGSDAGESYVTAFAIDDETGQLAELNRASSGGRSPAYVSVHQSGRYVFAANYASGHVASLPVSDDGRVSEPRDVVLHAGKGPHPRRQEGPHAHFITPDPMGHHVLACDLGVDKVFVYRFDPDDGRLEPNHLPYAQVSSGAGPRHLSFHPTGRFVYVINELDSTLSAFAYDGERGALQIVDTASTLPDDFTGDNTCAQVVVHPSGRFVYGSNRGHDSIAIFAIDHHTGTLRAVGHEPTQGRNPRNFNITPDGTLLLAANQDGHTIVPFRIDTETGRLTPTGQVTNTPAPVCIVFRAQG